MSYPDNNIGKVFFRKFKCEKKIGKGSFGTVYLGTDLTTKDKVAIKTERKRNNNNGILETEAYRLIYLQGEGIPKIICYGNNQTNNILIQELLDRSLEDLFNSMKKKFTLKTVCVIGIEMIKRIKFVHSKHHIHRDIKPDNFMVGKGENDNKIYIIDFGLSKKYYSTTKHQHIKFCSGKSLIGTARYCAKNAHRGYEQSRRDDIESIGYVLMYFLLGSLPWQGLKIKQGEDQFEKIAEKKYTTSYEELCKNQPEEFLMYFKHVDQLNFEDEPDYNYLISLFQEMINKYCNNCFYDFDWKKDSCVYLSVEQEHKNKSRGVSLIVNKNGLSTNDESRNLPDNNNNNNNNNADGGNGNGNKNYNISNNICDDDSIKKDIPHSKIDDNLNLKSQNEVICCENNNNNNNESKCKRKKSKTKTESYYREQHNETDCSIRRSGGTKKGGNNNNNNKYRRISKSIQDKKSNTNTNNTNQLQLQKRINNNNNNTTEVSGGDGVQTRKSFNKRNKKSPKYKEKISHDFTNDNNNNNLIQSSINNETSNNNTNMHSNSNININDNSNNKKDINDIIDEQIYNIDNINVNNNNNNNINNNNTTEFEPKSPFETIKAEFQQQQQEDKPPLYTNRLQDINIVTSNHPNSRNKKVNKHSKHKTDLYKDSTKCSCIVV